MNQSGIFPKFFMKPVQNHAKSAEEGRPIFEDVEFIEIMIAGDAKSQVESKVSQKHIDRWPREYEAFKNGLEATVTGTPITEWPAITASRAAELKALKIFTVEALAEIPDTAIQRIGMGGRDLVTKAKAYIEAAKDGAAVERYAKDNESLRNEVDMLKEQLKELSASIDKKKPGPKPKAEAA